MKHVTESVKLFSRTTSGQIKMWSCWIEDGTTVCSAWGIKNGKVQTTRDTKTPRGSKSAEFVALDAYTRQVLRKTRAGYVSAEGRVVSVRPTTSLDFDHLPRSFAPAKPIRSLDPALAQAWERRGLLAIQRKRNGMRHYLVTGTNKNGPVRVYSRGMDDMTAHFAGLIRNLSLPPGTILDTEFAVTSMTGSDDFKAVSEICRSKPDRARRVMEEYQMRGCDVGFVVFDVLFLRTHPVWKMPYDERYSRLTSLLRQSPREPNVQKVVNIDLPYAECVRLVKKWGWEGLVLWRRDQATEIRLNRSPARCNCYKYKPIREDDFVATGFNYGTGRNSKVAGALCLARRQGDDLVPMGRVNLRGDATRRAALRWTYPCVVEIKYESRSETGLRHPVLLRKREDKRVDEC